VTARLGFIEPRVITRAQQKHTICSCVSKKHFLFQHVLLLINKLPLMAVHGGKWDLKELLCEMRSLDELCTVAIWELFRIQNLRMLKTL
jgi:hypothetical protein